MNKIKLIIVIIFLISPQLFAMESYAIKRIIAKERDLTLKKDIRHIVNWIDKTYANLYRKLKQGKKLTIFIDPPHGKLPNGKWQGGIATYRMSCRNKPEEFYSIKLSRELYSLLQKNNYLNIQTTPDYLKVLQKKAYIYKNITFKETVKNAYKKNSFMIISEHLNNISPYHKEYGLVNRKGIYVTIDKLNRRFLRHIKKAHSGFLTLYNSYDASGFSKICALKIKRELMAKGLRPNSWQKGAVADDRFSYFADFPISLIFESGFISNPYEERLFTKRHHIKKVARSHYNALIKTIRYGFGVDISDNNKITHRWSHAKHRVELLKLSRIAIYYIKKHQFRKARYVISKLQRRYKNTTFRKYIRYFTKLKFPLIQISKYLKKSKKVKSYSLKKRYYKKIYKYSRRSPLLSKLKKQMQRLLGIKKKSKKYKKLYLKKLRYSYRKSAISKKIILPIQKHQSLASAISNALNPSKRTTRILLRNIRSYRRVKYIKKRYYSQRYQKWKYKRIIKKYRTRLYTGIYIIALYRNMKVRSIRRVKTVRLKRRVYQNHQYLNNSYFARKS